MVNFIALRHIVNFADKERRTGFHHLKLPALLTVSRNYICIECGLISVEYSDGTDEMSMCHSSPCRHCTLSLPSLMCAFSPSRLKLVLTRTAGSKSAPTLHQSVVRTNKVISYIKKDE